MLKLTKKLSIVLILSFLWTMAYGLSTLHAQVPRLINYQGRLTDKTSKPLEGSYELTFRIYDDEASGTLLWEEIHPTVVIQKGIFSILLGSIKALDLTFDKQYFLEIKVGDETMTPRQRIASSAYAIRAGSVDNCEGVKGIKNIFLGNGNVGIGTTNPQADLDISSNATLRLAPRSFIPECQEGSIFYSDVNKALYIYTGSGGWHSITTSTPFKTNHPKEELYRNFNLTRIHYVWSPDITVPSFMNKLRVKYEWCSHNLGHDYYAHNIQVLVNEKVIESFMTYQSEWTIRNNVYDISSCLRHDGNDIVKIQLTNTPYNEEDEYGFRNVSFEFQ